MGLNRVRTTRLPGIVRIGHVGSKAAIALAMAVLTCLAAGVASLGATANANKAASQRATDQYEEQLAGYRGEIQTKAARDFDAFNKQFRQLELSISESDQATGSPDEAQRVLAETLRATDYDLSQWLITLGGLFEAPVYERSTFAVDVKLYRARAEEQAIRLEQQARRESQAAAAWDTVGNDLVTVLTLIAVALFFLGVAASIGGRARRVLVGAGIVAAVAASGWTILLAARDVHRVPDAALEAYVRSRVEGIAAGAPIGELTTAERGHLDAALDAARQAVDADPTYLDARLQLASAASDRGLALAFAPEPDFDGARRDLDEARVVFEAIIRDDPSDPAAWWNLGYVRYVLDDAPGALAATDRALALRPGNPAILVNRATALIALGRPEDGLSALDEAIRTAATRPGGAIDWTLRQADAELTRLAALQPDEQRPALLEARDRVRSATVARRVGLDPFALGPAPAVAVTAVHPMTLDTSTGSFTPGDDLAPGAALSSSTMNGLELTVEAEGAIPDGAMLSVRVWHDGEEDADYRVDRAWSAGPTVLLATPYGRANNPMSVGAYHVEVFVDAARAGTFDFALSAPAG